MQLVDIYVREIGLSLPEKIRLDIEREIRTLVEDTLEDESQKQGRPIDEPMFVV